ncbi:hypothetical protein ACIRRH_20040 [Kitasatospora sp. NPDC101235]|uniref:hypothetical protein n=1 Tax=Kitasatospora sp. NPDC101235 TaxID=3364101 RepID=UPI003830E435
MENEGEGSRVSVGRRHIITAVPGSPVPGVLMPGAAVPGAADPALTVRRYIDHALICSACCR